jgi:hypothetical protein
MIYVVIMLSFLSSINCGLHRPDFVNTLLELKGPKYDGEFLHSKIEGLLGATRVNETLTNVVIPAFDVKNLQPTIFSTFDVCDPVFDHAGLHSFTMHQYMVTLIP